MRCDDVTSVSHTSKKQSGRVKKQDKLEMGTPVLPWNGMVIIQHHRNKYNF